MSETRDILLALDRRRHDLRMSCQVLARRSGLSLRTVQRVLSGEAKSLRVGTLIAMARALEMSLGVTSGCRARLVIKRQARVKARKLTAVAQGSAALEGQAVSEKDLADLQDKIEDNLTGGSAIRLWSES